MALQKNSSMFWVIGVAVVAVLSLVVVLFSITMPRFKLMQKLVDKLNLVSREILSGLWVIRAFGTQKYEEKRFDGVNRDLTKTNLFVNRVMTCMMPAMMLTMNAVTVLIVWVGADKINAERDAGRRFDGVYPVHHADCHVLPDDLYDVYYASQGHCICQPYSGGLGDRGGNCRPRKAGGLCPVENWRSRISGCVLPVSGRG